MDKDKVINADLGMTEDEWDRLCEKSREYFDNMWLFDEPNLCETDEQSERKD